MKINFHFKKGILLFLFYFPFWGHCSMDPEVDSLIALCDHKQDGEEKVLLYIQISEAYFQYNAKKSNIYAQKAVDLSQKLHFKKGIGLGYIQLAQVHRKNLENILAIETVLKALEIFEKLKDIQGIAAAYHEFGYIYKDLPNYSKSIISFEKSKNYYLKLKDSVGIPRCYSSIALLMTDELERFKDTTLFKKALNYLYQAHDIYMKTNNIKKLHISTMNISNIYIVYSRIKYSETFIDSAIKYGKLGAYYAKLNRAVLLEGGNYYNVGDAYLIKKDYKNAIKYLHIAYEKIELTKNKGFMIYVLQQIIKVYLKINKYDNLDNLFKVYYSLTSYNHKKNLSIYYDLLAQYYYQTHQLDKGYQARLIYEKYRDSITNEEKEDAISSVEMHFNGKQKDNEIKILTQEKSLTNIKIAQQKTSKNYLILTVLLILILFVLFLNRYLTNLKTRKLIEKKNTELEKLSIVAQEARNGILITDDRGNVEWYNEKFSNIHNLNRNMKDEIKKTAYEISKSKSIDTIIKNCVHTGKSTEYELNLNERGENLWIKTNVTPIVNANNKVHKLVFVETDISEIVKAKETAEKALVLQEQFLANTSHEIRTPMNGIIGMTDQILTTERDENHIEYLNAIKESSNNLMNIINGILDISKIKAGKLDIEKISFNLIELLNPIKISFKQKAIEKNIQFYCFLDPQIPEVLLGDPTRLTQILINFLSNAIKFTDKGSVNLSINVHKKEASKCTLVFKIFDTGIGIATEKLDVIFEAFSQAESDTNRLFGGTGLGLSISKSLIELLGGNVEVKSELGVGTEFCFNLEYEIGSQLQLKEKKLISTILPSHIDLSHLHILMVEDNLINQKVSLFLLNRWNIKTDVASNPLEAFELLKQNTYSLILMDLSMPIMSGIEATIEIRKNENEQIRTIPIIALTASAFSKERLNCLEAGMNDYISKPLNQEQLYSKIVEWARI